MSTGQQRTIIETYAFSLNTMVDGRPEVLFTAAFIHNGVVHLFYNMLFLYIFGRACEDVFGTVRSLLVYGASMIVGSLVFGFFFPDELAVGASGAVSGLVGAGLVAAPHRPIHPFIPFVPLIVLGVAFLIPNLVNLYTAAGTIANIAHIAGFSAGAVIGLYWRFRGTGHRRRRTGI